MLREPRVLFKRRTLVGPYQISRALHHVGRNKKSLRFQAIFFLRDSVASQIREVIALFVRAQSRPLKLIFTVDLETVDKTHGVYFSIFCTLLFNYRNLTKQQYDELDRAYSFDYT